MRIYGAVTAKEDGEAREEEERFDLFDGADVGVSIFSRKSRCEIPEVTQHRGGVHGVCRAGEAHCAASGFSAKRDD